MGVPWGCRCTLKISSHLLIWKGVVKSCFHHHQHLNFESHRPGTFKYTQMYWLSITVGQIALKPILCLKCPDCLTLVWPCSWAVVILKLDWGNCLLQGHQDELAGLILRAVGLPAWQFGSSQYLCKARRQEQVSPSKVETKILCDLITEVNIAVF